MSTNLRTIIGAAVWLGFVVGRVTSFHDAIWSHALIVFAALVLVPLAIDLLIDGDEAAPTARWFGWVRLAQLPAAVMLGVACWLPPGGAALLAALPWVAVLGLLAAIGLVRVRTGGWKRELEGQCRDVALMFGAIGAAWLVADRGGWRPLGFDAEIVALTAVHFHYAGLLLPLFAGLVQRELFFLRLASRVAVGVVLGVPAVALGITATQLGWGRSLETAMACGLALAGLVLAVLQVRLALDGRQSFVTRALLGVSGVALFFGMVLAGAYAVRAGPWLGIPQMRLLHGTVNAIGFALCGLLAWRRMKISTTQAGDKCLGGPLR